MSKAYDDIKKELIEDLKNQDLSEENIELITFAVNYIDSKMKVDDDEKVTMSDQVDKMISIAKEIHKGVMALSDKYDEGFPPYINNYISAISQYGGLYSYVIKIYKDEIISQSDTVVKKS